MEDDRRITAKDLPSDLRPVNAFAYYAYRLLFSLPIIGFIAVLICAASGYNINVRKFARSFIIGFVIDVAILIVLYLLCRSYIQACIDAIKSYLEQYGAQ